MSGQDTPELCAYQQIVDGLADGAMVKDLQGRYLVVNAAGAAMFNLHEQDIVGTTDQTLLGEEAARAAALVEQQVRESGKPQVIMKLLQTPDGTRNFESRISPFRSPQGQIIGTISVCRDVTGLHRHLDALQHLHSITSSGDSPEQQIASVLELGTRYLSLPLGLISRIEDQDYEILFVAPGLEGVEPGMHFSLGETYCWHTLGANDVVGFHQAGKSEIAGHPCYQKFSLEAYLGAPVQVSQQRFGTISFSSPEPLKRPFSDYEREFIRLCAHWVGQILTQSSMLSHQQNLLQSLSQGVFGLDNKGLTTFINPAVTRILGYQENELLGHNLHEAIHGRKADGSEFPRTQCPIYQTLEKGRKTGEIEDLFWHKNGTPVPVEYSATRIEDNGRASGVVVTFSDIRFRQQASKQLAEQKQLFETLFRDAPSAIILVDTERRVQLVNPAFERLFDYSQEEMVGQGTMKIYARPDDYAEHGLRNFNTETQLQTESYEVEYRRRDGQVFIGDTRASILRDSDGKITGYLGHISNATERRRQDNIKQAFISTVSHELRTPLTSLSGALSLIRGGAVGDIPEKMEEMLGIAINNSNRLGNLINDLLDMEKLSSGKMVLTPRKASLISVIDQAIASLSTYAEPYQVEVKRLSQEDIQVTLDADRLTQILNNLLSNACKHSPPGSTVYVDHQRLDQGRFLLRVIDHGTGIPEHFRPHVFEKFAQADDVNTRQTAGTGLGLALCKELVTRLNGVIGYESESGKGTCFWIRLPIEEQKQKQEQSKQDSVPFQGRPRILYVEDDKELATVVKLQLEPFDIAHVTTLAEAKNYVQRHSVDLILLDLFLPDGHGQSLWEEVHVAQPKLPIAVLSGYQIPSAMADQVAAVMTKGDVEDGVLKSTLLSLLSTPTETAPGNQ